MPRQPSFDVEAFESAVLDTILNSPVALRRREIFARCGFDNTKKALLTAFDRLIDRVEGIGLVECRGDKKNREYIATNPPRIAPERQGSLPKSASGKPPSAQSANLYSPKPPQPTFTKQVISEAAGVTDALTVLSDASRDTGLAALGVDKRSPPTNLANNMMMGHGFQSEVPLRRMILAAGDIVYDFDIPKIHSSLFGSSDNENIRGFAPFRDFFAQHTIVAHDVVSTSTPLIALDMLPRGLLETRLAVRMLQYQAGVCRDDALQSSVRHYLRQIPYEAPEALVATVIPLLMKLLGELDDAVDTFFRYCSVLPSLAHIQVRGLPYQNAIPTYEMLGSGQIKTDPDLSLLDASAKASCRSSSTLITVKFASKPNNYDLLPALSADHFYPVAILDDELVFKTNDSMPEGDAIKLMRIICCNTGADTPIQLRRGNSWGVNDWRCRDVYHTVPEGWDHAWWDSWVDLTDSLVQSVLNS